jgi:hypothetical protein
MTCRTAQRKISLWLDERLEADEVRSLASHLEVCPDCALRAHQLRNLRGALRLMPPAAAPEELTTALRVLASKERLNRLRSQSLSSWWRDRRDRARLWMENLMRPAAIPVGGGLVAALVLFSLLAPIYAIHDRHGVADVPTALVTGPALESSLSFGLGTDDIVIDVLVDDQGRMMDYSIVAGQGWRLDPALRKSIENTLLCTKFIPATMFGQPKSARLRITLRGDEVDVKG